MLNNRLQRYSIMLFVIFLTITQLAIPGHALSEVKMVKGQTVYVPVYSHIYHGNNDKFPFNLAATLCIRNTDMDNSITLVLVDYYDTDGKLVRKYQQKKVKLNPMASTHIIINEADSSGGVGANFIVQWESENKVTEPVIEAVMIGTQTQQGISFTSRGQVIKEN
jgi:hypothetical protein